MKENDFIEMRKTVQSLFNQYVNVRKKIGWKDSGRSATIERLARPFLDGYFTIAVAGKMSSGKSTFINSLIGENLLPTGHFQTTSGITWIISSDHREMKVTYVDGHVQKFTTNFANELRKLVAVPEEFDELPINELNRRIALNDSVSEILHQKPAIEKMTGTKSNEALWKKYIQRTSQRTIAEKVEIYLPLPEEYKGWRIVDTPGIGAIGGIQEATKNILIAKDKNDINQNVVDAVILLHKGTDNIQDESANKFAEDVSASMGELAKGRLFFVLTHSCSPEFINYREGILSRAENLFGNRLNIPSEKITYVDSLVQRFIIDAKKSGRDFSNMESLTKSLQGWSQEEWCAIFSLISPLYMHIFQQGVEFSNTSLFKQLDDMARFSQLRKKLYNFLTDEKDAAFSRLLEMIEDELDVYNTQIKGDIKAVSNGKAQIEAQIKETEKERNELNAALGRIQREATEQKIKAEFSFVDNELGKLSSKKTISEVRTSYYEIINKGESAEKNYFTSLIEKFQKFSVGFSNNCLTFRSLDMDDLERQAENAATKQVVDKSRPRRVLVEKHCCGADEYETRYPHTKSQVDFDKKRREFTAYVIKAGRNMTTEYINGAITKVNMFFCIVKENIDKKTNATIERLKGYQNQSSQKDQIIAELNSKLNDIITTKSMLKKYEK